MAGHVSIIRICAAAKAFEIGELEGAVSSLSVAVAVILTAVLAPIAINLVF